MRDQIEKIDNVLITATIALLAAFVVLYTAKSGGNIYFSVSTVIAITFLTLCLLLTLYAKYREAIRSSIFENQTKQWKTELDHALDEMMDDFYVPQLLELTKNALNKEENRKLLQEKTKTIAQILEMEKKVWQNENRSQHEYPRKLFVDNQGLKIQKILESSFSGPLKEKHAIIKYQIEIFSRKRFALFTLGLLAFILSMGIKLFI